MSFNLISKFFCAPDFQSSKPVYSLSLSHSLNNEYLGYGCTDGVARVADRNLCKYLVSVPCWKSTLPSCSCTFSKTNPFLLFVNSSESSDLHVWDLRAQKSAMKFVYPKGVITVDSNFDDTFLAVGSSCSLSVKDIRTTKELASSSELHGDEIVEVLFNSMNKNQLVSADSNGSVVVSDLEKVKSTILENEKLVISAPEEEVDFLEEGIFRVFATPSSVSHVRYFGKNNENIIVTTAGESLHVFNIEGAGDDVSVWMEVDDVRGVLNKTRRGSGCGGVNPAAAGSSSNGSIFIGSGSDLGGGDGELSHCDYLIDTHYYRDKQYLLLLTGTHQRQISVWHVQPEIKFLWQMEEAGGMEKVIGEEDETGVGTGKKGKRFGGVEAAACMTGSGSAGDDNNGDDEEDDGSVIDVRAVDWAENEPGMFFSAAEDGWISKWGFN